MKISGHILLSVQKTSEKLQQTLNWMKALKRYANRSSMRRDHEIDTAQDVISDFTSPAILHETTNKII